MEPNKEPSSGPNDPGIPQIAPPQDDGLRSPPPPFTPAADSPPAGQPPSQPQPPPPTQPPVPPAGGPQPVPAAPTQPPTRPVVGDGGIAPPPASGQVFTPASPAPDTPGRKLPKKLMIPVVAIAVLLIGSLAFYFGYWTNPSVIYSQSLSNTGKGYDRLIAYADEQSKLDIKSYSGTGSYEFKGSDSSVDGKISFKASGGNSETSFGISTQGTHVDASIRTIKSNTATPDVYLKVSGIKGLGTSMRAPDLDPVFAKLDDRWIFIDHSFVDRINSATSESGEADTTPTREQVLDEARAFGEVNQEYLFSTDEDKAVTKVEKKIGKETVDGRSTYHYKVSIRKDNAKKYILAQRDALKESKLNDWLKNNGYDKDAYDSLTDTADSAEDIKSSDTYDVWMDINRRVVYKVRVNYEPNPADNYIDIGLDYKGGDKYPFFISGKSKPDYKTTGDIPVTSYSFVVSIDTKTDETGFEYQEKISGKYGEEVNADFNLKPATSAVKIKKPGNAIPIARVLDDLGLGALYSGNQAQARAQAQASGVNLNTTQLGDKLDVTDISGARTSIIQNTLLRPLTGQ